MGVHEITGSGKGKISTERSGRRRSTDDGK